MRLKKKNSNKSKNYYKIIKHNYNVKTTKTYDKKII